MRRKTVRSIVAQCAIEDDETSKALDKALIEVSEFLKMSSFDLNKRLYHATLMDGEAKTKLPAYTIALLGKRFSDTVTKNRLLPLDTCSTAKIVNIEGKYHIEAKLLGNNRTGQVNRFLIPLCRKDNNYYADIVEDYEGPITLFEKGDKIFACFVLEVEQKCRDQPPALIFGIDLNMEKNVASLFNPEDNIFLENVFFDMRPTSILLDKVSASIRRLTKGKNAKRLSKEEKDELDKLYSQRSAITKDAHGRFISSLTKMADDYIAMGYNVIFVIEDLKGINQRVAGSHAFNSWLHSKWCRGRFENILQSKGYPVKKVYAHYTSQKCHKCNEMGRTYGRQGRLFVCDNCGLKDFNRDLNAARNIALRGYKYMSAGWSRRQSF